MSHFVAFKNQYILISDIKGFGIIVDEGYIFSNDYLKSWSFLVGAAHFCSLGNQDIDALSESITSKIILKSKKVSTISDLIKEMKKHESKYCC